MSELDFGALLAAGVFGEGSAGSSARSIVQSEGCIECESPAAGTIDFDLFSDLTQIPVCLSATCIDRVESEALRAMNARSQVDTVNTFSVNGLGRR